MRFCLVTYGSRGDVQPFIALALGLMAKGHEVTLAAPGNFKLLVEDFGVNFFPLYGDAEELVSSPECLKVIHSGNNSAFVRMALKKTRDMRGPLFDDIYAACQTADVIVAVNTCVFYIAAISEKLNFKWLIVQLNPPMIPTREFPMLMFNFPSVRVLNPLTYKLINGALWLVQKKDNAEYRQRIGLPPLKGSLFADVVRKKIPMIHAFSEQFISKPADWEDQYSVAGFFTVRQRDNGVIHSAPPEGLAEWIKAGDTPLYIGFGSIPFPKPELLEQVISDILRHTNVRIVFCRGWSPMPNLPQHPNLFVINQADHRWLMPQCRAALVHGGIGTVSGVLKGGIPVIVGSIFVDQPVWGKIIARRKLGVHIPWRKLSYTTLSAALKQCDEPEIATRVKEVSAILNAEDGVGAAINTIEAYCAN